MLCALREHQCTSINMPPCTLVHVSSSFSAMATMVEGHDLSPRPAQRCAGIRAAPCALSRR